MTHKVEVSVGVSRRPTKAELAATDVQWTLLLADNRVLPTLGLGITVRDAISGAAKIWTVSTDTSIAAARPIRAWYSRTTSSLFLRCRLSLVQSRGEGNTEQGSSILLCDIDKSWCRVRWPCEEGCVDSLVARGIAPCGNIGLPEIFELNSGNAVR